MYISVTKKVGALDAWAHGRVSLNYFFFEHSEIGQGGGAFLLADFRLDRITYTCTIQ